MDNDKSPTHAPYPLRTVRLVAWGSPPCCNQEHAMSWTTHYFDRRLNADAISRAHATEEGALRNACDLMLQKCIVKYVQGADNHRIGPVEIQAWCKAHKTAVRPINPRP
jgi:hypothetical protein